MMSDVAASMLLSADLRPMQRLYISTGFISACNPSSIV